MTMPADPVTIEIRTDPMVHEPPVSVDGDLGSMISIMSLHLVLFGVVCSKPLRRPQLQEILSH